jgi:glycosyltransferase involved in cell wall biosynthesis
MPLLFLSVIIPTYNEDARIERSLERLVAHLEGKPYAWEVLVVDDGSTDRTVAAVQETAARLPHIRLLSLEHRGKGWAVKSGMLASSAEWRFLCDADLSMPPEQLDRFLPGDEPPVEDIVIGSREAPGARRIGEPGRRHVIGRLYTWLVKLLAFRGIEDTQCGFKLFRGSLADRIFAAQRLDGFGFDVEVLFLARKSGATIRELAIDWYYYLGSKVTLMKGLNGFLDIARVRLNHMRGRYGDIGSDG